jgi:hypothetical protein
MVVGVVGVVGPVPTTVGGEPVPPTVGAEEPVPTTIRVEPPPGRDERVAATVFTGETDVPVPEGCPTPRELPAPEVPVLAGPVGATGAAPTGPGGTVVGVVPKLGTPEPAEWAEITGGTR